MHHRGPIKDHVYLKKTISCIKFLASKHTTHAKSWHMLSQIFTGFRRVSAVSLYKVCPLPCHSFCLEGSGCRLIAIYGFFKQLFRNIAHTSRLHHGPFAVFGVFFSIVLMWSLRVGFTLHHCQLTASNCEKIFSYLEKTLRTFLVFS